MRFRENLIYGRFVLAGSGIYRYAEIDIEPPEGYEMPEVIPEVEAPVPELGVAVPVGAGAADE